MNKFVKNHIETRTPIEGWGRWGPYRMERWASSAFSHAVCNRFDTVVFIGNEQDCKDFLSEMELLYAADIMSHGTAAEGGFEK